MRKIIVIGCPGSGKSTLSLQLHKITELPLYHLDMMYWNADKTKVEKSIFLSRLAEAMERDGWIIDGNYLGTMEQRIAVADTVIFLDYPAELCLEGVRSRRGKARPDMPWIESEEDTEFIEFIKGYDQNVKPKVLELICKYSDKRVFVFRDRGEADEFLRHLRDQ